MRAGSNTGPDFLVIGAQRAGTTWLHRVLCQHPSLWLTPVKELHYFDKPGIGRTIADANERRRVGRKLRASLVAWQLRYWFGRRDDAWYASLFHAARARGLVAGEITPAYATLPVDVLRRIRDLNPGVRLVYIMRDPVERAISEYWHAVRWDRERRPPEQALFDEPRFLDNSHYAMQLEPYLERFGRDQIYTLTTEELSRDPRAAIIPLLEWLGVDADVPEAPSDFRYNQTPEGELTRMKRFAPLERIRWSKPYRMIRPLVPAAIRRSGRQASSEVVEKTDISDDVYARLRAEMRPQVAELEALLGRSFENDWTTVYA